MKLLVITLPLTLAASLAWGGTILNTTDNLNPLIAPAATSETIAQLAGMKVVFNFGTSTETTFFNETTAEAMSTLRCLRKPHLKSITDFSDRFFQALMIEFPALLRNSQQKGERNGEYFNHRSRGLLNDSRGV